MKTFYNRSIFLLQFYWLGSLGQLILEKRRHYKSTSKKKPNENIFNIFRFSLEIWQVQTNLKRLFKKEASRRTPPNPKKPNENILYIFRFSLEILQV